MSVVNHKKEARKLCVVLSSAILQDSLPLLLDIGSSYKGRDYGVPNGHYHH